MTRWSICLLLVSSAFGKGCFHFQAPVKLSGHLFSGYENGYRPYTILRLDHAICVFDDHNGTEKPGRGMLELETVTRDPKLLERLDRLDGEAVIVDGLLFPASTGRYTTDATVGVGSVEPKSAAVAHALERPRPPASVKDLASYHAVIHTGQRLKIEVTDPASGEVLKPTALYVPFALNAAGDLRVQCHAGYALRPAEAQPKEAASCGGNPAGCTFVKPKETPATLSIDCVRAK